MEGVCSTEIGTTRDEEKAFQWYLKSAKGGNSYGQFILGGCYRQGIGTTKDEEKAFQWYLKSAEGGNSDGQYNLGKYYHNGIGTTKDEEKAFQWYSKSAEGGNSDGQYNLGNCYRSGIGTTKNEEKAFHWYLKSAEGGNHKGQFNLGYCYQNEIGTAKDEEKAFHLYLKLAEGGNSKGQVYLGECYHFGIGTTKDDEKAFQWFLKSAEGGNHKGQFNLGYCYQNEIGTAKDEEKAFHLYLKLAEGGNSKGQVYLGECYHFGIGTTKDDEKAFQWFLKSAEGGNSEGQYNLGVCYYFEIGTTKDDKKTFQWFLKSAEGGINKGQFNLGWCYHHGIGTTKDEEKAFQWYLKSAEGGNSNGQVNLAGCYQNGIGTIKDEEKAFEWDLKSAESGNSHGQHNLGICYTKGFGTTKDEEKAFQWYLKSAEGGNSHGQFNLGKCYLHGIGTTKDEEKVVQWILKSAEGRNYSVQQTIEWFYREEIAISTIKRYQNKLKQNINRKDINLAHSNSPIKNLNGNKNHNCCICWQKNGCIEICKNFKDFGRCHDCGNLNLRTNVCKSCKYLELEYRRYYFMELNTFVQMTELRENANEWEIWRCIDYSELKDFEYLDKGGFGTVWKAEWKNMPEEIFEIYNSNHVALKKLKNSKVQELAEEFQANFYCRSKYVLPILGLTQDPTTTEYAIVSRYMKDGNLRNFLQQNKTLSWTERLWLLKSFISGLNVIHYKGYIHRDLHPGNLMITEVFDNFKFIRLGDLGFCRPVDEITSSGIYGVLPYIAPEILNENPYTQASDIYSVGIIMWVISTGKIPFSNRAYDCELILEILEGLRPKIQEGTPRCYVVLMEKCWHKDSSERPSAERVLALLNDWNHDLEVTGRRGPIGNSPIFLNVNQEMKKEDIQLSKVSPEVSIHPEASLISKLLPPLHNLTLDLSKFFDDI
ncbi:hypothetical protein Glove_320g193 [Diversispora epigaea]|uniref:Protein kinase domain-containing protein n=1 Tax=Diversispora epigaea TaxID=1348612 RepID=A0A397HUD3_9GLOM|nr:hypothetical protein Glove_320g193 [Diversispora epigaea]